MGLKHLERFTWVGQFSGGTRIAEDYNETFTPLLADANKTNDLLKLYWVSGPTGQHRLPEFHRLNLPDLNMDCQYFPLFIPIVIQFILKDGLPSLVIFSLL